MPIHFNDLDVVSEVAGLSSALIVPCNMCPAPCLPDKLIPAVSFDIVDEL